jgi:hypothetical protein
MAHSQAVRLKPLGLIRSYEHGLLFDVGSSGKPSARSLGDREVQSPTRHSLRLCRYGDGAKWLGQLSPGEQVQPS